MRARGIRYLISAGIGAALGAAFAAATLRWAHLLPGLMGEGLEVMVRLPADFAGLLPRVFGYAVHSYGDILVVSAIVWAVLGAAVGAVAYRVTVLWRAGTRRQRRRTIRLACLGIAAIAPAVLCLWLSWGFLQVLRLVPGTPGLASVSQMTSAEFPPSARLVGSWCEGGPLGGYLLASVEMSPADVGGFIESMGAPDEASTSDRFGLANDDFPAGHRPAWWNPDSTRQFTAIRKRRADSVRRSACLSVLIGTDSVWKAVVYIEWMA